MAGLGRDASMLRFVRQHVTAKAAFPITGTPAALTVTAEAGVLLPWGARAWDTPTSISDRFYLGGLGAGTLRGFAQKGAGPSEPRRPTTEVGWAAGLGMCVQATGVEPPRIAGSRS